MEDYKGMLAELADLATEEQAMFTISVITKSDESFHGFMDARERLSKWIVEHAAVIDEVFRRQSALGIIFVSDMTEHFIRRILEGRNLEFHQLARLRPHVFMRQGHPLSGEASVTLEQLHQYPYAAFTQSDTNLNYAEEAVVGTGAQFDRVVCVSDRATAYNVMAHTNCVSTGSGVLPEGFGDDRLVTVPLTGQHDMRLGYIKLRSVPLSESGREFVDILRQILRELEG